MSTDGFSYFLSEYKKRLPDNEENKDFHEHIDYMIVYHKSNNRFYQERWNDWISPNDEKYWKNPNESEKKVIEAKRQEQEMESKKNETKDAIVISSCIMSAIATYGILGSAFFDSGQNQIISISFYGVIVFQGLVTILHELDLIPFSFWSWLY